MTSPERILPRSGKSAILKIMCIGKDTLIRTRMVRVTEERLLQVVEEISVFFFAQAYTQCAGAFCSSFGILLLDCFKFEFMLVSSDPPHQFHSFLPC